MEEKVENKKSSSIVTAAITVFICHVLALAFAMIVAFNDIIYVHFFSVIAIVICLAIASTILLATAKKKNRESVCGTILTLNIVVMVLDVVGFFVGGFSWSRFTWDDAQTKEGFKLVSIEHLKEKLPEHNLMIYSKAVDGESKRDKCIDDDGEIAKKIKALRYDYVSAFREDNTRNHLKAEATETYFELEEEILVVFDENFTTIFIKTNTRGFMVEPHYYQNNGGIKREDGEELKNMIYNKIEEQKNKDNE